MSTFFKNFLKYACFLTGFFLLLIRKFLSHYSKEKDFGDFYECLLFLIYVAHFLGVVIVPLCVNRKSTKKVAQD